MLEHVAHSADGRGSSDAGRCWCGGLSETASPHSEAYHVCGRCGTNFAAKEPALAPARRGHSAGEFGPTVHGHPPVFGPALSADETESRVRFSAASIDRCTAQKPGVVVEIGCREGQLLLHLRERGWQAIGIEPDPTTATAVSQQTGLEVRIGRFPDVAAPLCDLLVAGDVLGAVSDPLSFVRAARDVLRPGGVLFLQLPLLAAGPSDRDAGFARVFDPQEHRFLYSRESIVTLLETAGFELLENQSAWRRGYEIVIARRLEPPARQVRHLANLSEMFSPQWWHFIDELNAFGAPHALRQFTNWSKLWEYPWLWYHGLSELDWRGRRVVDLGSEQSPFPWWLATKGAQVTLIETRSDWIPQWEAVRAALGNVSVDWQIVDSCRLPFRAESVDVVTSLSVIEHQDDKPLAFREVARVLKAGGLFAASFDICEPSMGMTFPEWNGRALTMQEFERLVAGVPDLVLPANFAWNIEDIPAFLRWHRQTAPHHNYVTAAALLRKRRGLLARLVGRSP